MPTWRTLASSPIGAAWGSGAHFLNFVGLIGDQNTGVDDVQVVVKGSYTLANLFVRAIVAGGPSNTTTIRVLVNGANGNQVITCLADATGVFEDTVNSDAVVSGDLVNYYLTTLSGGTTHKLSVISCTVQASTNIPFLIQSVQTQWALAGTSYLPVAGMGQAGGDDTEAYTQYKFRTATTLSNLWLHVHGNGRSTATTFTLRKNGADGNQSISIGATLTGAFEDAANTDSIIDADLVNYKVVRGAGTGTFRSRPVVIKGSSAPRQYISGDELASGNQMPPSATRYLAIEGICDYVYSTTTEDNAELIPRIGISASNLFVRVAANGISASSTFRTRVNGANGNLSVSIGAGLTGVFEDTVNSEDVIKTDTYNFQIITGAGGTYLQITVTGLSGLHTTTPTVTTQAVTNISGTTATGNGTITSVGDSSVSQHGHCWNTTGTPTTADSKTQNGAGVVGAFTSAITGLVAGTQYYIRAYATNATGTSYGAEVIFVANQGMIIEPIATLEVAFDDSILEAAPTWTALSADLLSTSIKRGRMHDLDRVEAGTAICVLKNLDGNYWRDNTAGSYTPNVKPIKLVRISASYSGTTYRRFYGVIESWKHGWRSEWGGKVPVVTISCVDVFKSFARLKLYPLTGTIGGNQETVALASNAASGQKNVVIKSLADSATEGSDIKLLHVGQSVTIADNNNSEVNEIASINEDTYTLTMVNNLANTYTTAASGYVKKFPSALSGVRIDDVLAELGWPAALADIDAGQTTLAEFVPDADGTPALEHLLSVAESEGGVIFVSGTGKVVFQDRDARLGTANGITCTGSMIDLNTAQATFSDDGSDQKYIALAPEDDDAFIYNEARVSGDAITSQIYRDLTAQAAQGPRVLPRSGSLLSSNGDAFDQAYTIVERYNDSVLRCPGLLVIPSADPANLFPKVLLYDLSTRINLELNASPNPALLDRDYHIEGIEDKFEAGELWQTEWQLWDVNLFRVIQAVHTGYLHKESTVSYADAHEAGNADNAYPNNAVIGVGQSNDYDPSNHWRIFRGYLEFDTSSIGAAATIASAELIVEVTGYFVISVDFALRIVPATGVVDPVVVADYGDLLDDTTDYGSVTISAPAVNKKIIVVALTAAGIAAINKTGTTRFGLRSSRDISNTTPGSGASYQEYVTLSGSGSDVVPRLAVKLNEVF